jgi:trimeric autotransporter adhesin
MKYKSMAILVFCVSLAATASAQTSRQNGDSAILGSGTPNFIPRFSGTHKISNSIMFESGNSLGVGTTTPQATLDVESTGVFSIWGATSSTEPFASGVIGRTASASGNGVVGDATATSGTSNGVFGRSASPNGIGVSGAATATTGNANGLFGSTETTGFGAGVSAAANAPTGNAFGVFGNAKSSSGVAMFGYASAASGSPTGVVGFVESPNAVAGQFVTHGGSGLILQGLSGSNKQQVFTIDGSGNGFLAGNLIVTGTVSKGSGSFKIDHPLDPANKYLEHSFVESPDMMNIYNGVVVLDSKGEASVNLPKYFQALNSDFRYQLTAIGAPGPNLYIAEEISGNHFKVAGGKPGAKVSWQVTGVRQDAYAKAHRIKVEEDKPAHERGTYLHPELFDATEKEAIGSNVAPAMTSPVTTAETNVGRR